MLNLLFSNYVLVYQKKERVSRNVLGNIHKEIYIRRHSQAFREVVNIKKPSVDDFLLFFRWSFPSSNCIEFYRINSKQERE